MWIAAILGLLLLTVSLYWLFGAGGRSAEAVQSIAILPFANASGNPDTEYLSDGITESLMSRSAVFRCKGRESDPQAVGRDLKVQAVLTGRLVQRGENLFVSAELVDARDNSHLWSEQYKRMADLLAIQQEIGREITDKLRLKLTGDQKKSLARRYTQNAEAYQDYLRGRYFWNKRTGASPKTAIEHFEKAIARDPTFALAYAGLADCYAVISNRVRSLRATPAQKPGRWR